LRLAHDRLFSIENPKVYVKNWPYWCLPKIASHTDHSKTWMVKCAFEAWTWMFSFLIVQGYNRSSFLTVCMNVPWAAWNDYKITFTLQKRKKHFNYYDVNVEKFEKYVPFEKYFHKKPCHALLVLVLIYGIILNCNHWIV